MKDLIESDKSAEEILDEAFSGESVILSKGDRIIYNHELMGTVQKDYVPKDRFVVTDQGEIPNKEVEQVSIDGGEFQPVYMNTKGNLHYV